MLRRQVEDVEGSLPPKVAITLKCPMTLYQGAIYDWVKLTGTKRMDPAGEFMRRYKKTHVALQNKVMELRKVYPTFHFTMRFRTLITTCFFLWSKLKSLSGLNERTYSLGTPLHV